jgi:hypothetical protein
MLPKPKVKYLFINDIYFACGSAGDKDARSEFMKHAHKVCVASASHGHDWAAQQKLRV